MSQIFFGICNNQEYEDDSKDFMLCVCAADRHFTVGDLPFK